MTREKLNKLRADSQFARDLFYLLRENNSEGTLADATDVSLTYDVWQRCQKKADDAVKEWIAQDCMEHINFGTGKVLLNGKEVFTLQAVSYKFDPHP